MYYLKFYYSLNQIAYFQYNEKNWIKKNYKYSIKRLKKDIYKVLAQVKQLTILEYYKSGLKKWI